jgi:hypothetical protein
VEELAEQVEAEGSGNPPAENRPIPGKTLTGTFTPVQIKSNLINLFSFFYIILTKNQYE